MPSTARTPPLKSLTRPLTSIPLSAGAGWLLAGAVCDVMCGSSFLCLRRAGVVPAILPAMCGCFARGRYDVRQRGDRQRGGSAVIGRRAGTRSRQVVGSMLLFFTNLLGGNNFKVERFLSEIILGGYDLANGEQARRPTGRERRPRGQARR